MALELTRGTTSIDLALLPYLSVVLLAVPHGSGVELALMAEQQHADLAVYAAPSVCLPSSLAVPRGPGVEAAVMAVPQAAQRLVPALHRANHDQRRVRAGSIRVLRLQHCARRHAGAKNGRADTCVCMYVELFLGMSSCSPGQDVQHCACVPGPVHFPLSVIDGGEQCVCEG